MHEHIAARDVATGVLAVLAGTPLRQAAADIGLTAHDLADAIDVYQAAGAAALHVQSSTRDWWYVRIQFPEWDAAEHIAATHLVPSLRRMQNSGVLIRWWFIRKAPCWRLRCRPGPTATVADVRAAMGDILRDLAATEAIVGWWESIYEPETLAFGGPVGMRIAHELFHADSVAVLDYVGQHHQDAPKALVIGRREMSILLCTALFRAAGQDWHEQGDIWHRVTVMRPLPPGTATHRIDEMTAALYGLVATDTAPNSPLWTGSLDFATAWVTAFIDAGQSLGKAARDDTLGRGLRDTLAHHVIFHWNRLGLPAHTQGILAHAARDTLMNPTASRPHPAGSAHVA